MLHHDDHHHREEIPHPGAHDADVHTMPDGAVWLKRYLGELGEERLCALEQGLAADSAYVDDLDGEVVVARHMYALVVLRDLAVIRGVIEGRLQG